MPRLARLISEIHRRSLWQVLGVYVGVSLGMLELADQVSDNYLLPDWVYRGLLAVLVVGLPVVLATAFFQRGLPAVSRHDPTLLPGLGGARTTRTGRF